MSVFLLCMLTLFGLAIGSFLNVVSYRLPRGESLNSPPSHCPNCQHLIRNRHNTPVLGWLVLRGRCADCGTPISVRYPLVEALTGLLFLAIGITQPAVELPALLYFVSIGIALALIDLDTRRLPDRIVLPSYAVLALLLTFAGAWQHNWWALARAGVGALEAGVFFLVLAVAVPKGMGFGDVKLAGLVGMVLGYVSWAALEIGLLAGFVIGGLTGIAIIASHKGNRGTALPFGPFMILSALLAIFAATPIANAYLLLIRQ